LFHRNFRTQKRSHISCAEVFLDSWVPAATHAQSFTWEKTISRNGDSSIPLKKQMQNDAIIPKSSKIYVQMREGIQDLPQSRQAHSKRRTVKMFFGTIYKYHGPYFSETWKFTNYKKATYLWHCRMARRTWEHPEKLKSWHRSAYIIQPTSKIHCPVILSAIVDVSHLPGRGNATFMSVQVQLLIHSCAKVGLLFQWVNGQ